MSKTKVTTEELDRAASLKKAETVLDELLQDYKNPEEIIGENGLLGYLTKALVERCMRRELTYHLGYEKHDKREADANNYRNGMSKKTIRGSFGKLDIDVPRDRNGSYEPKLIPKHQRHFNGFDEKITSMYARGMTIREIAGHLSEMYHVDVSPALISHVTEGVMEQVIEWQNRPLDAVYPIVYLDALVAKIRGDNGRVQNKAIHVALGVNLEGHKEVLGMWFSQNEGAKFWLGVLAELKNRGVQDILIACVDGLTGFPEAVQAEFPQTQVQLCIVHMVRNSVKYVSWKDRKEVCADLRKIYQSANEKEAALRLQEFKEVWDKRYPMIAKKWEDKWELLTPFLAYPPEIRKVIYTTNAIESLHMTLRKVIKNRASFPNDAAAQKLIFLALQNASKKWTMPIQNWPMAVQKFAILFDGRMPIN